MDKTSDLINFLKKFKINANVISYKKSESYFYYDLKLNDNEKVKSIEKILDELSLFLKSPKPIIKIIHELGVVRLEFSIPNKNKINLFDIFTNERPKGDLVCLLGKSVDGSNVWMDLAKNPHMLIAGTTGSGKSVLLHNIIANILNYSNAKILLVDPKNIEFSSYEKYKNIRVGYSCESTIKMLKCLHLIMEERFLELKNNKVNLFPIVIIIDEFADLIMHDSSGEVYNLLCKLAQKSRAAKIHIIIATQRPSVDIISGLIKANFPARISCRVASHIDSKVVLDESGAQRLMGNGDALLKDNFRSMQRFQVAYTSPEEINKYFGKKH